MTPPQSQTYTPTRPLRNSIEILKDRNPTLAYEVLRHWGTSWLHEELARLKARQLDKDMAQAVLDISATHSNRFGTKLTQTHK